MSPKILTNVFWTFLFLAVFSVAPLSYAAELININTADLTSLETLNGIGASKGQAIIDYRTQHGAFAKIEDIMNVSGIGTVTYANIKDFITVGSSASVVQTPPPTTTTPTQSQAQSQSQNSGMGPPSIVARITTDARSMVGGGSFFSAVVYGAQDIALPDARFVWNFGDGTTAEGSKVFHTYAYPGKYLVSVSAAYNYSAGVDRVVVEAVGASVALKAEGDGSLLLQNMSSVEINIGAWRLVEGERLYIIPEDTRILAKEGVRFAAAVTGLAGTPSTILRYPNGSQAATATVADESPLRGERVTAAELLSAPVAAQKTEAPQAKVAEQSSSGEVLGASATQSSGDSSTGFWASVAGLTVLLTGGAVAAYYLRPHRFVGSETSPTADEFNIE